MKFRPNKKNIFYLVFLCGLLPLFFFLSSCLKNPLLDISEYPLKLAALIRREIGAVIFYRWNFSQKELLEKEVGLLRQKNNALNEAALENERLKALLVLKEKSAYKVIAARVIARSPDNWASVVIIDKGALSGIKRGFVALNYSGLAGRVVQTTLSTSKIVLINDPSLSVSALVQRSRQEGVVSGLGNSLIMKYLPKEADLKISDLIITSGLSDNYPKDLIIGRIIDIGEEFSGLSRYAIIKPAVNLSTLEELLIIMP